MDQLDLKDIREKYPSQLSGGMKKRVALARALVTDPEIVLFDEPTTGLHFEDIKMLLQVLNTLVDRGNTVVVIEHNMDVTAVISALRSEIDDVVGGLDDVEVVLDHEHGVALVGKPFQHTEELADIVEVQSGRGLVQKIDGAAGLPP